MTNTKSVFGIDLGTTYSCIARINQAGEAEIVSNAEGQPITPSVVYFERAGKVVVGQAAKEEAIIHPDRVVSMVKRYIGQEGWSFECDAVKHRAEEISAFILRKVAKDAAEALHENVEDVVITVPAYFGVAEREATKNAGRLAGLNVVNIIPEPTAAAIAYGLTSREPETLLVFDLGGGTFDVTVIALDKAKIEVVFTSGERQLGGRLWDEAIFDAFAQAFESNGVSRASIDGDLETKQSFGLKAEDAKKAISTKDKKTVRLVHGAESISFDLTREDFDARTKGLCERTIRATRSVLQQAKPRLEAAGLRPVSKILLVGGSTYMPQIEAALANEFGQLQIARHDPHLAVAKGAALYCASQLQIVEGPGASTKTGGMTDVVVNVTSKGLGFALERDAPQGGKERYIRNLIPAQSKLPIAVTETFKTRHEGQTAVLIEPMESASTEREPEERHCTPLNTQNFEFAGPMPKGSPIAVSVELGETGLLKIKVVDPSTGRMTDWEVELRGIMTEAELKEALKKQQSTSIE